LLIVCHKKKPAANRSQKPDLIFIPLFLFTRQSFRFDFPRVKTTNQAGFPNSEKAKSRPRGVKRATIIIKKICGSYKFLPAHLTTFCQMRESLFTHLAGEKSASSTQIRIEKSPR
jgi:hypothetical protein